MAERLQLFYPSWAGMACQAFVGTQYFSLDLAYGVVMKPNDSCRLEAVTESTGEKGESSGALIARRYISALGITATLIVAGLVSLLLLIGSSYNLGESINISGLQRMLLQQIEMLSTDLVMKGDWDNPENLRAKLKIASDRMESDHAWLIEHEHSPDVLDLYYAPPADIDRRLTVLVNAVRALIATDDRALSPENKNFSLIVSEVHNAALLRELERVVDKKALESDRLIISTKILSAMIFAIILFSLLLESRYIFRPMRQMLEKREVELESLNKHLGMSAKQQSALKESLLRSAGISGMEEIEKMTAEVATTLGVARVSIWEQMESCGSLKVVDCFDSTTSEHTRGEVIKSSDHNDYFLALQAEPLIVADNASTDPRTASMASRYPKPENTTGAMLCVPLKVDGNSVGLLCLEHKGAPHKWSDDESGYTVAMAGMTSLLLGYKYRNLIEQQLQAALAAANLANQAKSEFLSNMSHELRTPLSSIMGFSELALASDLPTCLRDKLEQIYSSGKTLLALVNDILDISKIEEGRFRLERFSFDLTALIKKITVQTELFARNKGLRFSVHIDPAIPTILTSDPNRIRQVIVNLLGNALKFTEKGEVSLRLEKEEQSHGTFTVRFSVKDTGIGIPKKRAKKIFERFTQADSSISRKFGGAGLGTTISKQLVELMGGRIWLESEPERGSVFYFTICFAVPPQMPRTTLDSVGGGSSSPPGDQWSLSILLAEDTPLNQEVALAYLKRLGHTADIAVNGAEAVEYWKKGNYSLILMDLHMPVMDGLTACRVIRDREQGSGRERTPIIALTADAMSGDRDICISAGMDDYLTKPVNLSSLSKMLLRFSGGYENTYVARDNEHGKTELALCDLGAISDLLGGDSVRIKCLLATFNKTNRSNLSQLVKALDEGDLSTAHRMAHSIKGAASHIRAGEVYESARRVEAACREGDIEQGKRGMFLLKETLYNLLRELKKGHE